MDTEKIKNIISDGENGNIELKLSFSDDVIISLVAMANSKGGLVIVGVSNDKKIGGVKLDSESIQHWANEIKNKTQPFLSVDIEKQIIENKTIVVFEVARLPRLRKNGHSMIEASHAILEPYCPTIYGFRQSDKVIIIHMTV